MPGTIWDIKPITADFLYFGCAAVYDGYFFCEMKSKWTLEGMEVTQFTGHDSICYAFEPVS